MFLLHFFLMRTFIFSLHQHLKIQNAYPEPVLNPWTTAPKRRGGLCNPLFILQNGVHAPSVYKMHWQRVHRPLNIQTAQDWMAEFHTWNFLETVPDFNISFLCFCCIFCLCVPLSSPLTVLERKRMWRQWSFVSIAQGRNLLRST